MQAEIAKRMEAGWSSVPAQKLYRFTVGWLNGCPMDSRCGIGILDLLRRILKFQENMKSYRLIRPLCFVIFHDAAHALHRIKKGDFCGTPLCVWRTLLLDRCPRFPARRALEWHFPQFRFLPDLTFAAIADEHDALDLVDSDQNVVLGGHAPILTRPVTVSTVYRSLVSLIN